MTVDQPELRRLEDELRSLRATLVAAEELAADAIAATHPSHRRSATNLVHYVALRRHDVRDLQHRLAALGLSSLGRAEAHVLSSIDAVLAILCSLDGTEPPAATSSGPAPVTAGEGRDLLARNADRLLGPSPERRNARIMVTMPSVAATDPELVGRMVADGMDVARVNCAHDDAVTWRDIVERVRGAVRPDGERVRVAMDLAGPKMRTGPLQPGPPVVRLSPARDRLGNVTAPAQVLVVGEQRAADEPGPDASMPVVTVREPDWIARRTVGDRIELTDARGAHRTWHVVSTSPGGCVLETDQTAYVVSGTELVHVDGTADRVVVGALDRAEEAHRVEWGDEIVLTRSLEPTEAAAAGVPHVIGCTLEEAFGSVLVGERVFFDDGKIGGRVSDVTPSTITVVVTDVRPGGAKLKAGKGINFPDSDLAVDALTGKDLDDLAVAVGLADVVNLSFVRRPADVERLQAELAALGADELGIVLKIETASAFEHLPDLLLTALSSPRVGVMIARGDLAVEMGFERLAEVQEEILWLCESAHVPVIWATQVLDTLARTGRPSRAEVTDAAMSERSECVMLNKGPHITEAIRTLDSILVRMQHHQHKKRSLLRRLRAWDRPVADVPGDRAPDRAPDRAAD